MKNYLETSGPWSQLVELGNIELKSLVVDGRDLGLGPLESYEVQIHDNLEIVAGKVTHRDEFSETVGYRIFGSIHTALFIPDIDSWDGLESSKLDIAKFVSMNTYAFLDATFYDDNELPGRDMSKIPHPRVTETMDLIEATGDESLKEKVRFIHINHTNPLRRKDSPQYKDMTERGFKLAYRGEQICL